MKTPEKNYAFYDIPGPLAIAHRGGDLAGPEKENSMKAFQAAVDAGITYLETDCILTKDGVLLAFHGSRDAKQEKETGLPQRNALQKLTYQEILNDDKYKIGGEPIPRLEDVLRAFPETRFFIDPKTKEAVKPLADLINRLNIQDRISIGAFSYRRTKGVAKRIGGQEKVATALGIQGAIALVAMSFVPILAQKYLRNSPATSIQVPHILVTPNRVKRAQEAGMKVLTWATTPATDDNQAYMTNMIEMGLDGFMSDHVQMMKDTILAHDPTNQSIRRS